MDIFLDAVDYGRFIDGLSRTWRRFRFQFHAYALMPNHYHLLVETPQAELSRGMHFLNTLYSRHFNQRHSRVGHVFQGRFKTRLVDTDSYLLTLSRYIHQNPVKAGLADHPWNFPWSSCRVFLGLAQPESWLNVRRTMEIVGEPNAPFEYRRLLETAVQDDPWRDSVAQTLLGSADFLHSLRKKALEAANCSPEYPFVEELMERPSADFVVAQVEQELARNGWSQESADGACAYFLRENAGLTLREIGRRFGLTPSGMCRKLAAFARRLVHEDGLLRACDRIERSLSPSKATQSLTPWAKVKT